MSSDVEDRGRGALIGLAVGDALGMPTQSLSRAQILRHYGYVDRLRDAIDTQPIAPSMPAGSVTDDTEQALLVAGLLIDGDGRVDAEDFVTALVRWEQTMRAKGSRDLLGPSTKAALDAVASGRDPSTTGLAGTTNGAAMRITPVAIAVPPEPAEALLTAVYELSFVTHHTGAALAGAAVVAGAVSAGVEGADLSIALDAGLDLAERAEVLGNWVAGASVVSKTRWALRQAADLDEAQLVDFLVGVVGTSVQAQESVVAALVIADRYRERPYDGLCLAVNLGGDTDTIAAISGAILGAVTGPAAFDTDTVQTVLTVSDLDLEPVLNGLLKLRARSAERAVPKPGTDPAP